MPDSTESLGQRAIRSELVFGLYAEDGPPNEQVLEAVQAMGRLVPGASSFTLELVQTYHLDGEKTTRVVA